MYLPAHFTETDLQHLDALAARDSFGTLVSLVDGAPFATHLPVLYRRDQDSVTLLGHWARPNPQWRNIEGQRALFMLHGAHAYISPRWYPEPQRHVPTWNYSTAHLYGAARLIEDPAELARIVATLADVYEHSAAAPWRFEDSDAAARLRGIVGFELRVEQIELKLKLSQNHPAANIEGAIAGLETEGGLMAREVAQSMRDALARKR